MEKFLNRFKSPEDIQNYLSKMPYNPENYTRSAAQVWIHQKAHCAEGAFFAAIALEKLGHKPQFLHFRSHRDDDHVVAIFKEKTGFGAIGKSNTTLLTWRDPYFKSLSELAMSYFPFYFNTKGQMSLFEWAAPIALSKFEKRWNWRNGTDDIGDMTAAFYEIKGKRIMTTKQIEKLKPAPKRLTEACFLGANKSGLYKT